MLGVPGISRVLDLLWNPAIYEETPGMPGVQSIPGVATENYRTCHLGTVGTSCHSGATVLRRWRIFKTSARQYPMHKILCIGCWGRFGGTEGPEMGRGRQILYRMFG